MWTMEAIIFVTVSTVASFCGRRIPALIQNCRLTVANLIGQGLGLKQIVGSALGGNYLDRQGGMQWGGDRMRVSRV